MFLRFWLAVQSEGATYINICCVITTMICSEKNDGGASDEEAAEPSEKAPLTEVSVQVK